MENVAEILSDPSLTFNFPSPEPLSIPILQLNDVSFNYVDKPPLFKQARRRQLL